jgi:hypothetical protein
MQEELRMMRQDLNNVRKASNLHPTREDVERICGESCGTLNPGLDSLQMHNASAETSELIEMANLSFQIHGRLSARATPSWDRRCGIDTHKSLCF